MMRRSFVIFIWILIGALASGLGMSLALHRANEDRIRLTRLLGEARVEASTLLKEDLTTSDHLRSLSTELTRSQAELDRLRRWQTRLKEATPLLPPHPSQTKGWSEFASVPLGVSIRIPPGMQANTSDDGVFIRTFLHQQGAVEEQWLGISRYTLERAQDIYGHSQMVAETGSITHLLGNRLLQGTRGSLGVMGQKLYLFSVEDNATPTYLIWAKTVDGVDERTILDTLATLSFR